MLSISNFTKIKAECGNIQSIKMKIFLQKKKLIGQSLEENKPETDIQNKVES